MNSISDKISSFPEEFINELVQYCLDCGTGIEYTETNSDGSKNLTTDAERLKPAAYNGKVRYIRPETINWFISDDVLLKTKYILRLKRSGKHIDLCDFDEWVTICKVTNCNELTLDEAYAINNVLWNHNITPMELVHDDYELIVSDGYNIERTIYPNETQAVEAMKKAYNELNRNQTDDEWDEQSYINDTSALLYDCGENVYVWSVMPYGRK